MEKKIKSNKGLIIGVSIFAVLLVLVIIFALKTKNSLESEKANASGDNIYEVMEYGTLFKGISVVSNEQKISVDKTLGDIESVKVTDKAEVKKGDTLIVYSNGQIKEQVSNLNRQIESLNEKINRNVGEKEKNTKAIAEKESELGSLKVNVDPNKLQEVTEKEMQIKQEIQGLKSKIEINDSTIVTLKDSINDLNIQLEPLNSKITKEIKAEIDGIVYINEAGLNNPMVEYIKIVSQEPLVKGEASEFDVESLKVDADVEIKVISNGEKIEGKIISIDELPESLDGRSANYNFFIKPNKAVRVGFTVEIKEKGNDLTIPKEFVMEENSKLYVAKVNGAVNEKIEIKAELNGELYNLKDESINVGDKLIKNPLEILKGDN